MEFVAHRAGNSIERVRLAGERADLIELDVHLDAGDSLEVRHGKILWPTQLIGRRRRLWEKWHVLPADTPTPAVEEILAAADSSTVLWFDLKGVSRQLPRRLVRVIGERRPVTVSSKSWWLLRPLTSLDGVRTMRSAGNRLELALLLWLPSRTRLDGAVVHRRLLTDTIIGRLRQRGQLFTWAVDSQQDIDWLRGHGVSGVIVDDLALVPRCH